MSESLSNPFISVMIRSYNRLDCVIELIDRCLKQDYKKAVEWYLLAAKNGDAHGQCQLSYRLQDGMGIKKNKDKSEYWFNQSRKNGFDCQK